jgi:hypothetical protein
MKSVFKVNKLTIVINFVFLAAYLMLGRKALAADANVFFSPSSTSVENNCYPSLDIMLDTGGQETTGVDVIIYYDQTKLAVHTLSQGALYSTYETIEDVPSQGKIVIQARALVDETFYTVAGEGEKFATITFYSTAYGTANVAFKYDGQGVTTDTNVTDLNGNDILGTSVSDASVIVSSGASCPGATSTITPTPGSGSTDEDTTNGLGGNGTATSTPTTYQAPTSGTTSNTIALISLGMLFTLISGAFALAKRF